MASVLHFPYVLVFDESTNSMWCTELSDIKHGYLVIWGQSVKEKW